MTGTVVVTATRIETSAARRALGGRVTVIRIGVGGRRGLAGIESAGIALSVGVCGALDHGLSSGDAVIPDVVGDESGRTCACDHALIRLLRDAAAARGIAVHSGPMLTVDHLSSGGLRNAPAAEGWIAADMESARVAAIARIAVVRVVLDTPEREIDARWEHPARALLDPRLWPQAWCLARETPRFAQRAAEIAAAALASHEAAPQRVGVSPR